jgi:ribosomal protein S17E
VQEQLEFIKKDYDQSKKTIDTLAQEKAKMEREKQALYVTIHEKEKKNSELLKEQKKYEKNESMSVDKLTEL